MRAIEPAEYPAFYAVGAQAFHSSRPEEAEREQEIVTFEFDRSAAAFDGDEIVGTSCAYTFRLSIPGGSADTAGISAISVLPAYRRRGIMSAMMEHLLTDSLRRGEAVAALFASESEIYGRFGFGCASEQLRFAIRRGEGRLNPLAPLPTAPPGAARGHRAAPRIRIGDPAKHGSELAAVYAAVASSRPGLPGRDDRWWQARTADPEYDRQGSAPLRCVIAEDASGPRGYALYSARPSWGNDGISASQLNIHEIMATDPQARIALWSDLLTRDLIEEVVARGPVDDPLLPLLAGRRRARASLIDGLWIRLIDVPAALSQRRYACGLDLVIEVIDPAWPAHAGRYRLRASAGGQATCEPSTAAADVVASASALGAAYLGGMRLGALAGAGQVAEIRPGTLAALSAAMSWDPAPWCPMIFESAAIGLLADDAHWGAEVGTVGRAKRRGHEDIGGLGDAGQGRLPVPGRAGRRSAR